MKNENKDEKRIDAQVVFSELAHCRMLAEAMDEAGKDLIRAGWGVEPAEGIEAAFWSCPPPFRWTILLDGAVVGMFGCAASVADPDIGYPWLTTAPGIGKVKLRFIRQSREYIEKMFERYELLISHAHRANGPLLGWLKWCGFRAEDTGGDFLRCTLKRGEFECVCRR